VAIRGSRIVAVGDDGPVRVLEGPGRAAAAQPLGSLLEAGVRLAFGFGRGGAVAGAVKAGWAGTSWRR